MISQETFADGSTYVYTYDSHQNMTSATDSTGTTTMQYNAADELVKISYPSGLYLEFTYNTGGLRTQSIDQSGYTINYVYDSAGRLSELTDGSGALIVQYTYDADGRLSRKDMGNGTYTTYTYDADGNVLDLTNFAPGGTINSEIDYIYNSLGLETSEASTDGTWTYTYDADGQLIHAVFASTNSTVPSEDLAYNYDADGNRTSTVINGATTVYTSNNMNEYTTVGGVPYTYDADGNLISDGTNTYTYNALNQLIGVTGPSGTTNYTYNALGQRVASTTNGQTTQYLNDPSGLGTAVGEYSGSGALIADYTYGLGLTSQVTAAGSYYYDFDALGSTVGLTNSSGSYVDSYSYLPFGGSLSSATAVANPFQFVGASSVVTETSGLLFMRSRYMLPVVGRFTSQDPLGLRSPNAFAYTGNNPVSTVDPSGLSPQQTTVTSQFDWDKIISRLLSAQKEFLSTTLAKELADLVGDLVQPLLDFDRLAHEDPQFPSNFQNGINTISFRLAHPDTPFANNKEQADEWTTVLNELNGTNVTVMRQATADVVVPHDPNDKAGPAGYGDVGYVSANTPMPYTIDFENVSTATAPAQIVTITDQLSSNLDWRTFQLGQIAFGNRVITVPAGRSFFETTVDLRPDGEDLLVQIDAGIDPTTGIVHWTFASLDPDTGQAPIDASVGFLPPDDANHDGEGYVTYTVKPLASSPTGTVITNQATVTFDEQPPLETDTTSNVIDFSPPPALWPRCRPARPTRTSPSPGRARTTPAVPAWPPIRSMSRSTEDPRRPG